MSTGIVRVFQGLVRKGAEEAFGNYLDATAVPDFLARPGLLALDVAEADDQSEYLVLTVWRDVSSIQDYVGDHSWRKPKLSSEEKGMLTRTKIHHYRQVARFERVPLLDDPISNRYPHPHSRVRIDTERRVAFVDGRIVELPPLEFRLLEQFASAPGKVLSPVELANTLWAGSVRAHPYDVRRAVYRLRRLLGPGIGSVLIRTRPGYGYFLDS
jgi:DNA-binding winged helix-turn-helix (wHTH) protein